MVANCQARGKKIITGMGRRLYARLQSGDTLIEVVVAMMILGMMILGLVPLFSRIHIFQSMNAAEAEAYNLAEQRVEAIKSAPYASTQNADGTWSGMGTYSIVNGNEINGDPAGSFPQVATYNDPNSPGITYYIDTQIRYKQDPSRVTGDPTTVDYKDITVAVTAQIPGEPAALWPKVTLNTRVTQESQWGEMPGGNVYVEAENSTTPVPNKAVYLIGPWGSNCTTYEGWTDSASGDTPGAYLFASLLPGTYTMEATDSTNPWDGWMVAPGTYQTVGAGNPPINLSTSNGQWCIISTNITTYMSFQAALAPIVTLQFTKNSSLFSYSGTIQLNGTGTLAGLSYPLQASPSYPNYTDTGSSSYKIPDYIYPGTYNLSLSGGHTASGSITIPVPTTNNPNETVPVTLSS